MKAKDLIEQNKPPNIVIYGPAGSGKTALVSQASKAYIFDCDNGMRTAVTLKDKFSKFRREVEFDIYVDAKPQAPRAFQDAKQELLKISSECAAGTFKYDAVIIDSLTGLCRACQLHVLGLSGDSLKKPEILHWGIMVNEIENILTILRSLNVLTIVTAHEMVLDTDNGILIKIMSITKPHGVNKIPWLFDEVLYSKVKSAAQGKFNYTLSGRSTSSITTRTRSGFKEDVVHNEIGLEGILEKIGYKYGGNANGKV